jgi:glycosyltransferase involved in cell wall biosynthesis
VKIALIAPPFIPVPPHTYGGTELFLAHLAEELSRRGHEVIVYANGESRVNCEVRSLYARSEWPPTSLGAGTLRNLHHSAWALRDAAATAVDVVHLNDAIAVPMVEFVSLPALYTMHHPHDPDLSELYDSHPEVSYVAISRWQRERERMPRLQVIHHGIRLADYRFVEQKRRYLSFLGRIAPMKGAHLAIEIAHRTGIPLKIAGEVQPVFHDYWKQQIEPRVDGRFIEYIGPATMAVKNDLLANSMALLFPIQWEEPFGLVMIEAMACGTPVLAFPGGAVAEVVKNGVSGWICRDIDEIAIRACDPAIDPGSCRDHAAGLFSVERMATDYERLYSTLCWGSDVAVGADVGKAYF